MNSWFPTTALRNVTRPLDTPRRIKRRWLAWGVGALLLIPVVLLVLAVIVGLQLQAAYRTARTVPALLAQPENRVLAYTNLRAAALSLDRADATMLLLRPLLTGLGWLPVYGPTMAAAPELVGSGRDLAYLAVTGLPLAEPFLAAPDGLSPLLILPGVLKEAGPAFPELAAAAVNVEQRLAAIETSTLVPALAEQVAALQAGVKLASTALQLGEQLVPLLGLDGQPRTYLILTQNNHELRGTGGFVSSIGVVTVLDGQIIALDFQDSYAVDRPGLPYPAAPQPMQQYMHIPMLTLRDVNWSPDLPTTARLAQTLYAQISGRQVDGVITINLVAAQHLVGALEPLDVPGVSGAITAANFVTRAKELWAAPAQSEATLANQDSEWWEQRKDFIPLVADAARVRVERGDFSRLRLLRALVAALEERAIQVWVAQPAAATIFAQQGWDGALQPLANADFLALVDTNMGYNKVDAVVERAISYQVDWAAGERGRATATITYRHPLGLALPGCDPRPQYGLSYDDMIARCYFTFLRVYAPEGSELIAMDGVAPESIYYQPSEGGAAVFGGYLVLPPQSEQGVTIQYWLPPMIQPTDYALVIRRQSGSSPLPITLTIDEQMEHFVLDRGSLRWQMR
jgi:hypothetical protein